MYNTEIAAKFFEWFVKQPQGPAMFKAFCEESGIDIRSFLGTHYKCKIGFKTLSGNWICKGQIVSEEKYNALHWFDKDGRWEKITINAVDNTNSETRKSAALEHY